MKYTDIDMRLVTSEGGIVPYTVHPSARALRSKRILDRVYAALVPRSTHKNS
jgi:hypothetical protein